MKNNSKKLLGIIAMAAAIGLLMASCGGDDDPRIDGFSVSGQFNRTPSNEVRFNLSEEGQSITGSLARAVGTGVGVPISGRLQDGAIIFLLTGTFNPAEGTFTASAASSTIRYTINGAVDANGRSLGITATLMVRPDAYSDNWSVYTFIVVESAVDIEGDAREGEPGTPIAAHGLWRYSWSDDYGSANQTLLVSPWTWIVDTFFIEPNGDRHHDSMRLTVAEVVRIGPHYEVIIGWPQLRGASRAEAEEAVQQFLREHNLVERVLPLPPGGWYSVSYGFFYEIVDLGHGWGYDLSGLGSVFGGWLDEAEANRIWNVLDLWSQTNYLERFLIARGVQPDLVFQKMRMTPAGSRLTFGFYYNRLGPDHIECTFTTVAAARAAMNFDPENLVTFTR